MLTIDTAFDNCWLAADEEEAASVFFCAQLFPSYSGHQLVIGMVEASDEYLSRRSTLVHMPYSLQTYSTEFWAVDPTKMGNDIMRSFSHCMNPRFPIELVYLYGGFINNEAVRIVLPPVEVH